MNTWTHKRTITLRTKVIRIIKNFAEYKEFKKARPGRSLCELCGFGFHEDSVTNIATTDKGNKLICESCTQEGANHGLPILDYKIDDIEELKEEQE